MKQVPTVEGLAFRLRPVVREDAAFIVELRANPALSQWVNPTSPRVEDQLAWLDRYFERDGDHYFVIERMSDGAAEGLISVYDVAAGEAEWGRWLLRPGSLAAVESAWLVYRAAFDRLGLDAVHCRTVAANERVVSFHDSCGIPERRVLPGHVELRGQRFDSVEHRLTRAAWPQVDERLARLAALTARRLQRGA